LLSISIATCTFEPKLNDNAIEKNIIKLSIIYSFYSLTKIIPWAKIDPENYNILTFTTTWFIATFFPNLPPFF